MAFHFCKKKLKHFWNVTPSLLQIKMMPGSNIFGHERALVIRVSFSTCIAGTVCLPLFGLLACVFISSVFHFEDSTGTHCQVVFFILSVFSPSWAECMLTNMHRVFPGSQLPAFHQCLNKSQSWVPHMAVLHWAALGAKAPGGFQLLQFLQGAFCLQVPWECPQLPEPGLFSVREPGPLAPHLRFLQWNILWVTQTRKCALRFWAKNMTILL